ncbi:MAG: hypothetical protein EOP59_10905, partial [Sphingomonadales bacterium]
VAASVGLTATPKRALAHALLASAVTLEASFAVVSIASDLRYHLWPMIATALALVLLAGEGVRRRVAVRGGVALALCAASGAAARLVLPAGPATYQEMLRGL